MSIDFENVAIHQLGSTDDIPNNLDLPLLLYRDVPGWDSVSFSPSDIEDRYLGNGWGDAGVTGFTDFTIFTRRPTRCWG